MSSDPPKEPATDRPVADSASADRSADQLGGGGSDRSSSPRTGEPNANASHFDESDRNADNAGTNADRMRAKADSIGMFGSNNAGYFVFGDLHQTIGSPSAEDEGARRRAAPRLDPVDPQTIAELAEVYVAPPDFRDATVPFAQGHHLLLLGTRPRWGNMATAIRLLAGLPTLYRLPVTDDLSALPVDRLEEGCGYILDATAGPALAVLGLHDIETLDGALARRRSRLVVIADLARAADHIGRPMWRALTAPPSAYDVVIAHLTWRSALPSEQRSWWRRPVWMTSCTARPATPSTSTGWWSSPRTSRRRPGTTEPPTRPATASPPGPPGLSSTGSTRR